MGDPQAGNNAADREAAEWHVRLGERPVSAATLEQFRLWRTGPGNAEAYRRIEALWRSAGTLSGDRDIQAATRSALRSSRPRPRRAWLRRALPAAAVAAPALVAALALALWLPTRGAYTTEVGGQRLVRLEDGSRIQLDTDTRVKVRFKDSERRVLLERGQALFMVARDPARPFRVVAGEAEITALGTVFDVRREAAGVRVTLVEGAVAVVEDDPVEPRRWRLSPGQQVRTSRAAPEPMAVDAQAATSWSTGRLVFHDTPLREAVAEVNRYLPEKIVLSAPATENVPVNGVFAAGDREAFISAASDLFGLSAQPQADGGVRLVGPSAGG